MGFQASRRKLPLKTKALSEVDLLKALPVWGLIGLRLQDELPRIEKGMPTMSEKLRLHVSMVCTIWQPIIAALSAMADGKEVTDQDKLIVAMVQGLFVEMKERRTVQ